MEEEKRRRGKRREAEKRIKEEKEEKRNREEEEIKKLRGGDRGEGSIENNRRHLSFSEYLLDTNDSSPVLILRVAVPAAGQWSCVVFY